jgi:hypothetical protein
MVECVFQNTSRTISNKTGKAHNEMLLGENVSDEEVEKAIGEEGKVLV